MARKRKTRRCVWLLAERLYVSVASAVSACAMPLRALDLFCGGGGAARGLMAAGFSVVGIDVQDHAGSYPGEFLLGDALTPPMDLNAFDLIWASPPCQAYSQARHVNVKRARKTDLIDPCRALLAAHPMTCIENVPDAPIRADLVLTGPMVGLNQIWRKRHFELSFFMLTNGWRPKQGRMADGSLISVMKKGTAEMHVRESRRALGLPGSFSKRECAQAMGCPMSMTRAEIGEAVPPAYAELIGHEARRQIEMHRDEVRCE